MSSVIYGITEEIYYLGDMSRKTYGIAVYAKDDSDECISTVLDIISDISSEKEKVEDLVRKCNLLELSPIHFHDVVEDFLAE